MNIASAHQASFPKLGTACVTSTASRQPCSRHRQSHTVHAALKDASSKMGLVLEVDGALIDIHMDGHRAAFNKAFADLGFDCVAWTPAVYNDLLSSGDGSAEGLVTAYFNAVGWPLSTPDNERHIFTKRVHEIKRQMFDRMVKKHEIPLRPAADQVIKEALAHGAVVALLAGTCSEDGTVVAKEALHHLGPDVAGQVRVFSMTEGATASQDGGSSLEEGPSLGLTEMLQRATFEVKQREANTFMNAMTGGGEGSGPHGIRGISLSADLKSTGQRPAMSAEWLAAVGATLDVPFSRCVVLAGQNSTLQAAASAGMVPVALPRRLAYNGAYPSAKAKFEGFGVGGASWTRLQALMQ